MWWLREGGDVVDVTVTVYPLEGEASRIAKELLSAASHAYEVRVVSHPKFGFVVPEDVFERFQQAAAQMMETQVPEAEEQGEPQQKRRGRPRKVVVGQEEAPQPEQESEEQ
jgi:hypothetical protein